MILVVMRGLSGSGKSTLANHIHQVIGEGCEYLSTDHRFMVGGRYVFDGSKLAEYHIATFNDALAAFKRGVPVVLDNTNTQRWMYEQYVKTAYNHGYQVVQASLYDNGYSDEELAKLNVHGVPVESIRAQRQAWQDDKTLTDVRWLFMNTPVPRQNFEVYKVAKVGNLYYRVEREKILRWDRQQRKFVEPPLMSRAQRKLVLETLNDTDLVGRIKNSDLCVEDGDGVRVVKDGPQ